jgi:hypothetical protein
VAVAGFTFLRLMISNKQDYFWARPVLSEGKEVTYMSLPHSRLDILNSSTRQAAKVPHCPDICRQVVKLSKERKPSEL